ncbi:GntR family transcriptional regulator [Micromonospora chersina]|uniref:GntR family transcriptional regulator n=1 Tax=Micromonospora chersina TaxID=47854 RepID=UPI0037ABF7F9
MIEYRIDRRSGVLTYLQLVHQTRQALRLGLLRPGDKLPAAREVVASTGVNPNTVLKAYRELEREGLVEARRGLGTFVCARPTSAGLANDPVLRAGLTEWMRDASAAGLEPSDIEALFAAVIAELYTPVNAKETNN